LTIPLDRRLAALALVVLVTVLALACASDTEDAGGPDASAAPDQAQKAVEYPTLPEVVPSDKPVVRPDAVPADLGVVWEAWSYLRQDYVDPSELNGEDFSERAIRGMLTVLGDPQTAYLSPEIMTGSFSDVFRGNFEGIGAHVNMNRDGQLVIQSPIPGGPAEAAGIKPGDIILEVDGESLEGLSLLEAVSKVRGPKGSTVELLVKHLGALDPVLIPVVRDKIPLVSVRLRSRPEDRFAHVRIEQFYPTTPDDLRETILEVIEAGTEGIILDVRNNDGGTLASVVGIASLFLKPEDDLVLYVEKGDGTRQDWRVRDGDGMQIATDVPMVMLINERSASSSEVLAGALQDHGRATIIGEQSFGKGSVNILRPLSNGGGLYITIAHWHTPTGRLIHGEGITPDIEVTHRDAQEQDIQQLRRAIEELTRIVDEA
jgi:carboxyl-terminal processing protease